MVTARTLKGAQVYVTFYPDCEENVGGYYCQVYTDENCISEIDNFMVHVKDIADKKDPYAAVEELAREYIESIKEY